MGSVRCGQLPYRFAPGDHHHPKIPDFVNINVTSGNRGIFRNLSPMILGPFVIEETIPKSSIFPTPHPGFTLTENGKQRIQCTNFENYWQGSKIYDVDLKDGVIQMSFLTRRVSMLTDLSPHRRALPKSQGTPVASYFDGQVMSYLEARIRIYCPQYAYLVRLRPEYQQLKERLTKGENLHIIGYDGRDVPITKESMIFEENQSRKREMNREILRTDLPFGHELVLCCLLTGLSPWKEEDVLARMKGDTKAI